MDTPSYTTDGRDLKQCDSNYIPWDLATNVESRAHSGTAESVSEILTRFPDYL